MNELNERNSRVLSFMDQLNEANRHEELMNEFMNFPEGKLRYLQTCKDDMRSQCIDCLMSDLYKKSLPLSNEYKNFNNDELNGDFSKFVVSNNSPEGTIYYLKEAIKKGSPFAKRIMEAVNNLVGDTYRERELNIDNVSPEDLVFKMSDDTREKLNIIGKELSSDEISEAIRNNVKDTVISEISRAKQEKEKNKQLEDEFSKDPRMMTKESVEVELSLRDFGKDNFYTPSLFEGIMVHHMNQAKKDYESGKGVDMYAESALDYLLNKETEEEMDEDVYAAIQESAYEDYLIEMGLLDEDEDALNYYFGENTSNQSPKKLSDLDGDISIFRKKFNERKKDLKNAIKNKEYGEASSICAEMRGYIKDISTKVDKASDDLLTGSIGVILNTIAEFSKMSFFTTLGVRLGNVARSYMDGGKDSAIKEFKRHLPSSMNPDYYKKLKKTAEIAGAEIEANANNPAAQQQAIDNFKVKYKDIQKEMLDNRMGAPITPQEAELRDIIAIGGTIIAQANKIRKSVDKGESIVHGEINTIRNLLKKWFNKLNDTVTKFERKIANLKKQEAAIKESVEDIEREIANTAMLEAVKEYTYYNMLKALKFEKYMPSDINRLARKYAKA